MSRSTQRGKTKPGRRTSKAKATGLPSVESEIISSLREAVAILDRGERLEDHFTVRHRKVDLSPPKFRPADVRAVRRKLGASQALFAHFLAVSVKTVQSWEQGSEPPPIARRVLELMRRDPASWIAMLNPSTYRRSA